MGRLFTSFDEAWAFFLGRTEALERFYGQFPDDEEFVAEGGSSSRRGRSNRLP